MLPTLRCTAYTPYNSSYIAHMSRRYFKRKYSLFQMHNKNYNNMSLFETYYYNYTRDICSKSTLYL